MTTRSLVLYGGLAVCAGILTIGAARCQSDAGPVNYAGRNHPGPPLPQPHPTVAAIPLQKYAVPDYGLSGSYPKTWEIPKYSPDANTVFELTHGPDTCFELGFLPGVRSRVKAGVPNLPEPDLLKLMLDEGVRGAAESETFFAGTNKTELDYDKLTFGTQEVRSVTMLIERPTGVLEGLDPEAREQLLLSQKHYFDLCPEGARRLARQYVWVLGDDVWIAQLVAPPATFLQRATEVEEAILPHLAFTNRKVAPVVSKGGG